MTDALTALYHRMLDAWNSRSAADVAATLAEDGTMIGFDGSEHHGRAEVTTQLGAIFADHPTAAYVAKVRGVRMLGADAAVLSAVVGMVPPGAADLKPELNAVQTMVAAREDGEWQIVLMQNTPAQYHGRPELVEKLTDELREDLRATR
jgi:uncharacterized protein (TIGR02246 family)